VSDATVNPPATAEPVHDDTIPEGYDDTQDHIGLPHDTSTGLSNTKLAMWMFLGSECLLFGGLISTYMLYRNRQGDAVGPDQLWDIPFTSATSFVLLMSSLTMVLAVTSAQRRDERRARLWLVVTALLGGLFLITRPEPEVVGHPKGLFVLEAWAAGVPVVQPDHGAFPEMIAASGGGWIVPPGNPQALAEQLHVLLADAATRKRYGEAGRQYVLSKATIAHQATQLLEAIAAIETAPKQGARSPVQSLE